MKWLISPVTAKLYPYQWNFFLKERVLRFTKEFLRRKSLTPVLLFWARSCFLPPTTSWNIHKVSVLPYCCFINGDGSTERPTPLLHRTQKPRQIQIYHFLCYFCKCNPVYGKGCLVSCFSYNWRCEYPFHCWDLEVVNVAFTTLQKVSAALQLLCEARAARSLQFCNYAIKYKSKHLAISIKYWAWGNWREQWWVGRKIQWK